VSSVIGQATERTGELQPQDRSGLDSSFREICTEIWQCLLGLVHVGVAVLKSNASVLRRQHRAKRLICTRPLSAVVERSSRQHQRNALRMSVFPLEISVGRCVPPSLSRSRCGRPPSWWQNHRGTEGKAPLSIERGDAEA
jgi:hypothetical protein